jgi:uncharacterized membrane protein
MPIAAASAGSGWTIGFILAIIVVVVVAAIVIAIVALALRIAKQADAAVGGVTQVKEQSDALAGIERINDSGVRILHSARALRKVAVGR